jgi:hypothetical protein
VAKSNALLAVAALLAGAAYLFAEEPANAGTTDSSGDTNVSNGFGINNPLNIRYITTNPFNGQIGNHGGYGQYDTLENGVRAGGLELDSYNRRGLDTVTKVVSTWAPSTENNTAAYIADVSQRTGFAPDEPMSWPEDKVQLIQAMAFHENGYNNMTDEFVQAQMVT